MHYQRQSPFFSEIWNQIGLNNNNSLLIAHNAIFDIDCLYKTLSFYKLKTPEFNYKCTFKLTGLSLTCACQAYDITLCHHHDALIDAKACAEIYLKIIKGEKPDCTKISSTKEVKKSFFEGHERIKGDLLKPDFENGDPNSPFFNKKVVFTGVLSSIERKEAAKKVKKLGADIDTSITKRTKYVVAGSAPGPSKLKKIENYQKAGCDIQILFEKEFIEMLVF